MDSDNTLELDEAALAFSSAAHVRGTASPSPSPTSFSAALVYTASRVGVNAWGDVALDCGPVWRRSTRRRCCTVMMMMAWWWSWVVCRDCRRGMVCSIGRTDRPRTRTRRGQYGSPHRRHALDRFTSTSCGCLAPLAAFMVRRSWRCCRGKTLHQRVFVCHMAAGAGTATTAAYRRLDRPRRRHLCAIPTSS